jgi:hypothetical protein
MTDKIKSWLDKLFYQIGKQNYDFYLQYSEQEGIKTKWKKYSQVCFDPEDPKSKWFIQHVNQRQVLPIEVVLDLEKKEQLRPAIEKLKSMDATFYVFETGSRGYHIHIFFNRELTEKEKLRIIKLFGADTQKASSKCLISLEYAPHWKSGKIKQEVDYGRN